jgi:REP element-mobilizing transposase RayT
MSVRERCLRCYKYHHDTVDTSCSFCQGIGFAERLLCELTREDQIGRQTFECIAFRPNLALVGAKKSITKNQEVTYDILQSDKVKWFLAFAKQQLEMHPDEVVYDLKYHLCLVTNHRRRLLEGNDRYFTNIAEVVKESGDFFEGSVFFLGMGTDHIHIYIDGTPDYSVDELVIPIRSAIEQDMRDMLPDLVSEEETIFNPAYFVETIGSDHL